MAQFGKNKAAAKTTAVKKTTAKKSTTAQKEPKVTQVPTDQKKELNARKEAQEKIGADTKTVSQELKRLREQQKEIRERARKLREEQKAKKEATKAERKNLTDGKKGLKEAWAEVRTGVAGFRKTLRIEDAAEVERSKAATLEAIEKLTAEITKAGDARLAILQAETLTDPAGEQEEQSDEDDL